MTAPFTLYEMRTIAHLARLTFDNPIIVDEAELDPDDVQDLDSVFSQFLRTT